MLETAASVISAIAAILQQYGSPFASKGENTSPSVIAYIEKDGIASFQARLEERRPGVQPMT
ncbi:MAG: hypothetical protein ACLTSX_01115 [Collinsella sp.]